MPKGSRRTFSAYSAMVDVPSSNDRRQLINGPLANLSQVLVDVTLLGGGTVVFQPRYDAAATLKAISSQRITDFFLVEPQLFDLMDHPDLAKTDLSSLRALTHIGASAPPVLRLRARERFGPVIAHTYGASEEGLVSILLPDEHDPAYPERFATAGRVIPGVEVSFRGGDGKLVDEGEIGTIEVRSRAMADGYRNRPDVETLAFADGWYRSGDLGFRDASGFLHILGRAVDIERGVALMTPTMVEDTLCRTSSVRYATVVVDHESNRWLAFVLPWPDLQINIADCCLALKRAYSSERTHNIDVLPQTAIQLTPQGKPDREALLSVGRLSLIDKIG